MMEEEAIKWTVRVLAAGSISAGLVASFAKSDRDKRGSSIIAFVCAGLALIVSQGGL